MNSRTYYTLAACSSLRDQNALALDYGQKALALGLANDNKEDICHAIFIIARTYSNRAIKDILMPSKRFTISRSFSKSMICLI